MKKTTKSIIIAAAVVVVLVGILLLVKFLPSNSDNDTVATIDSVDEISLLSHIPAEIKQIEVSNEHGEFTLLSETPTVTSTASDGTTSEATQATIYTLVNYEDMELLTGTPDALASNAASMTATKKVDDGSKKSDFGFDNPRATVKVTYTSGEVKTIYLGNDAASSLGAYVMIDGDKNVYLVPSDSVTGFTQGAMDMLSTEIGSAASTEEDAVFSKMVFGGRLFGEDVVIENLDSPAYSESYLITSPDNTVANEENVSYMVNAVRNLSADKVLEVNADDETLKEYGLDDPYVTVDAEYPDVKVNYAASEPDADGNIYLATNGLVYQISAASVPWVTYTYEDMLPASVLSPKFSAIDKIVIETTDDKYEFDISRKETTTTVNDTDVETTETTIKCGDTTIDEGTFNVFYQNLTSAKRAGSGEIPTDKKALLKVTYTFSDGTTASAAYYEAENRKCPVLVNDTLSGTTYESYVTAIISDVAKIAAGEAVSSIV